jgi:DinB superfamily
MSVFTNPASRSAQEAGVYTAAVLDLLGDADPMEVLRFTPSRLREAIAGLTREQLVAPEAPGKWSIRHALQHLSDSEMVWAFRLRMILAHDRPRLTGYDQDLWSEKLHYDVADPIQAIDDFGVVRRANLRLLAHATPQDLERVSVHSERGEESVARLIRLYAGHDLLHLNQIARIRGAVAS